MTMMMRLRYYNVYEMYRSLECVEDVALSSWEEREEGRKKRREKYRGEESVGTQGKACS